MNDSRNLSRLVNSAQDGSCVELTGRYVIETPAVLQDKQVHFIPKGKVTFAQAFSPDLQTPMFTWLNAHGSSIRGKICYEGLDDEQVYDQYYPFTGITNNNNNFAGLSVEFSDDVCIFDQEFNNKVTGLVLDCSDNATVENISGEGFSSEITQPRNWHILVRVTNSENASVCRTTSDNYSTNLLISKYSYKFLNSKTSTSGFFSKLYGTRVLDHGVYISGGQHQHVSDFNFRDCPSSVIRVDDDFAIITNGSILDSNVGVSVRANCTKVDDVCGQRVRQLVRLQTVLATGQAPLDTVLSNLNNRDGATATLNANGFSYTGSNIIASGSTPAAII